MCAVMHLWQVFFYVTSALCILALFVVGISSGPVQCKMVLGDLKTRKCQCVREDDRIGANVIRGRPCCCLELAYVPSHREVLRTLDGP